MEQVDVAIIGAGWHGIAAAKTYQSAYPSQSLVILDSASSVGGVWAKERLYQDLRANNVVGSYEMSDLPMAQEQFGVGLKQGQMIPGDMVHAYMEAYVQELGLVDKLRLNCCVEKAEYTEDCEWVLTLAIREEEGEGRPADTKTKPEAKSVGRVLMKTSKLIVATGLTSQPFMPRFEGEAEFKAQGQALVFHVRDFAMHEKRGSLKPDDSRVTVLGGSKSAFDVVYSCATRGMVVHWVIRKSGYGPNWISPAYVGPGRFKRLLESLPGTRLLSLFSPCAWNREGRGPFYAWLHRSWLGRKLVDWFWALIEQDLLRKNRYNEHPATKKLKPWASPFWVATSLGILNYPTDFFDLVRDGKVRVHIADIERLADGGYIYLSNNERIATDALICCTGWEETPGIQFLPEDVSNRLGFPGSPDILTEQLLEVNQLIPGQFPKLKAQPPLKKKREVVTAGERHPIRLARFMVPPAMLADRSIVFVGYAQTFNTTLLAEIQALWAAAYLNNELAHASPFSATKGATSSKEGFPGYDHILRETALHTEFGKWRCPRTNGRHVYPNFVFDVLPYIDMLLGDLGVSPRRKSSTWAHWMEPHGVRDYQGLVEEWKVATGRRGTEDHEGKGKAS
ncbi:uncharacterized protein BDV14DRAFT_141712 [Aspergillus stella-maris]|uniref:uncharacterized protein n=1 Tax=Aspergillus stella-maris TaxID=1810926 RepID=UPI003CCCDD9E